MKIARFFAPLIFAVALAGCHNHQPHQQPVDNTPPVFVQPTPDTPVISQPPTIPTEPQASGGDDAIINAVLANGESRDIASGSAERAVIFGDNYVGTPAELHECVSDAKKNVLNLVRVEHFDPKNIRLFLNEKCTKKNYEDWTKWLFDGADKDNRRCFFGNSSHGAEDTDEQGRIIDVIVTWEMIKLNRWDSDTEVAPSYWATTLRSTSVNYLFLNDSCHAGGAMRTAVSLIAKRNNRMVRSIDGPAPVQARLDKAIGRGPSMRELALTGTVIPACQPSELSEEDSVHGGLGTEAWWKARKSLPLTSKSGDIVREANRLIHSEFYATQHIGLIGQNKPLFVK